MPKTDFSRTTDAEFCAMGKKLTASIAPELPIQVDSITRLDGVSVICAVRMMAENRSISVKMSDMASDWQPAVLARWNAITCGNALFNTMARRGWRFTQNLSFISGERIVQNADCSKPAPDEQ